MIGGSVLAPLFDAGRPRAFGADLAVLRLRASLLGAHVELYRALGGWQANLH